MQALCALATYYASVTPLTIAQSHICSMAPLSYTHSVCEAGMSTCSVSGRPEDEEVPLENLD